MVKTTPTSWIAPASSLVLLGILLFAVQLASSHTNGSSVVLGVEAILGQLLLPTPSTLVKGQVLLWGARRHYYVGRNRRPSIQHEHRFLRRIARAITGLVQMLGA